MLSIANKILMHYDSNARDLPWRVGPKSSADKAINPYHVWLSEIMLQQTTVAAVIPYFEKFTTRWPDFDALAAAAETDVMAAWAGLGYYARARNLVKCARTVSSDYDGILPQDEQGLRLLSGIGDYTAAAIASIAFGRRALVVDANIERIIARIFAIDTPLPKGKKQIKAALDTIVPEDRAGDLAQGLMDIGASICSAKNPKCMLCPLNEDCQAYHDGRVEAYPVKPAKKIKPERIGMAWWIVRDGHVLLIKRPDAAMLGGMRALPDDGWKARQDGDGVLPFDHNFEKIGKSMTFKQVVQHSFTHFSLKLSLTSIEVNQDVRMDESDNFIWWPIDKIEQAGLPTVFAKAINIVMKYEKGETYE